MIIREVKMSDIDNLSSLFNSYRMFYGKDSNIKVAKKFLESRIKLCDSKIYVSEVDKCLTGFIQLYPIFSSTRVSKYWLLNDLLALFGSKLAFGENGQGLPIDVQVPQLIFIALGSIILCVVASWYPAYKAQRITPANSLRSE